MLWCEAHGLTAERAKHLALAVLSDPAHATARGLMGLVAYHGRWERPETISNKIKADEELARKLAEYNARRAALPARPSADAHFRLARWCEENGLQPEAKAHYVTVTGLDPSRDAAWRRLGLKRKNGRWVSDARLAAECAEADAQKAADKKWKPLLAKWRAWLKDRSRDRREAAEAGLADLTDPRAVPAVWTTFVVGKSPDHARAVRLLGQIDTALSTRSLAFLAVFDADPEVRRAAAEVLRERDPREFAERADRPDPRPDPLPGPARRGPGVARALFVEGRRVDVLRNYAAPGCRPRPASSPAISRSTRSAT